MRKYLLLIVFVAGGPLASFAYSQDKLASQEPTPLKDEPAARAV